MTENQSSWLSTKRPPKKVSWTKKQNETKMRPLSRKSPPIQMLANYGNSLTCRMQEFSPGSPQMTALSTQPKKQSSLRDFFSFSDKTAKESTGILAQKIRNKTTQETAVPSTSAALYSLSRPACSTDSVTHAASPPSKRFRNSTSSEGLPKPRLLRCALYSTSDNFDRQNRHNLSSPTKIRLCKARRENLGFPSPLKEIQALSTGHLYLDIGSYEGDMKDPPNSLTPSAQYASKANVARCKTTREVDSDTGEIISLSAETGLCMVPASSQLSDISNSAVSPEKENLHISSPVSASHGNCSSLDMFEETGCWMKSPRKESKYLQDCHLHPDISDLDTKDHQATASLNASTHLTLSRISPHKTVAGDPGSCACIIPSSEKTFTKLTTSAPSPTLSPTDRWSDSQLLSFSQDPLFHAPSLSQLHAEQETESQSLSFTEHTPPHGSQMFSLEEKHSDTQTLSLSEDSQSLQFTDETIIEDGEKEMSRFSSSHFGSATSLS